MIKKSKGKCKENKPVICIQDPVCKAVKGLYQKVLKEEVQPLLDSLNSSNPGETWIRNGYYIIRPKVWIPRLEKYLIVKLEIPRARLKGTNRTISVDAHVTMNHSHYLLDQFLLVLVRILLRKKGSSIEGYCLKRCLNPSHVFRCVKRLRSFLESLNRTDLLDGSLSARKVVGIIRDQLWDMGENPFRKNSWKVQHNK